MKKIVIETNSEEETISTGFNFAKNLVQGSSIAFYGDLGSGKTEFIKGICDYFQVDEIVSSPTFTLVNKYIAMKDDFEFPIFHIDLYRIKNTRELEEIGLREILESDESIKLMEWAEKTFNYFESYDFKIQITFDDLIESKRSISISDKNSY
ncbi:MAG: tRNA (adenosine(37)-N6)-threonylcarbamoyltransferase complex ATPase subunit type 1 TsaE [Candidatus Kapabacteria bacterium]|nr:tRNA (adenosine(37)-N6)-threonylcarbamoyltransferase complex ATPase subunit type 1 TsaE [Candidatus Kapabacteria bacterium]